MRAWTLAAGAMLALAACGDNGAEEKTANAAVNADAIEIEANDTTAIDAATNDAANMAAEANATLTVPENETNDAANAAANNAD